MKKVYVIVGVFYGDDFEDIENTPILFGTYDTLEKAKMELNEISKNYYGKYECYNNDTSFDLFAFTKTYGNEFGTIKILESEIK